MRRHPKLFSLSLSCFLLGAGSAWAIDPGETDPVAIMKAVDTQAEGDRVKSRLAIKVSDSAGRERTRVVQSRTMKFEGGTKQMMLFEKPADVRNTGFLSMDYDDGAKDDDQWLYLPSLRKSTRISSSDKSGSFMGTDLSYADMTRQDPKDYTYKILKQSVKVGGDDCWLLEAKPKTAKAKRETGYIQSHVWVSKSKLAPLMSKSWLTEGRRMKFIKFSDFKKLAGVWFPHKILAQTKRGKEVESRTAIVFTAIQLDQADVTEGDFTQRRLEQGL